MEVHLQRKEKERLARIAARRGMRGQELASQIICRYLQEDKASVNVEPAADDRGRLGTELAALFPKHGPDFVIPELRGYTIESPFEPSPKAAGLRPADSRGRLSPHKSSRGRRKKRA
jgi:hypothetical protein